MTIGTLAARIMADASGIKSGMGLTRSELKITRQAFIDSSTDVDKLNTALAQLESARDKGAFQNEEQYARALAAVRAELDPVVIAQREAAEAARQLADEQTAAAEAAAEAVKQQGAAFTEHYATAGEKRVKQLSEAYELL